MTFAEKAKEMLTERGMTEFQADAVLERVKADPANEVMQDRWEHSITHYGEAELRTLWYTVRTNAVEWMDENCPRAWFRPMFAGESDQSQQQPAARERALDADDSQASDVRALESAKSQ
jgi:hypothetical protein